MPVVLSSELIRVYFSPRDREGRGVICALDLNVDGESFEIAGAVSFPLLSPESGGSFSSNGVTIACVLVEGNQLTAYFLGWSRAEAGEYRSVIGLATGCISHGPWTALDRPVLDCTAEEPHTLSYPWVLREKQEWRMWYGTHLVWTDRPENNSHGIKLARSKDGRNWQRSGHPAVWLPGQSGYGISRPCVLWDGSIYRMWYSFRRTAYCLRYAESVDGERWELEDRDLQVGPPSGDWDAQSMEYAAVFDHRDRRYMLYNGNGYGRTGFGLAVLD